MGTEAKKERRSEAEIAKKAAKKAERKAAATGNSTTRDADTSDLPVSLAAYAHATRITGAKKVKKKCCRSTPRCKGCPVLLMRAARLEEAGLTGKDLKKALKKARAA